jgi:hypothetical protein
MCARAAGFTAPTRINTPKGSAFANRANRIGIVRGGPPSRQDKYGVSARQPESSMRASIRSV